MFPLSIPTPETEDSLNSPVSIAQIIVVPRSDRWQIHHRLQELMIPCWCLPDGSLQVEVQHVIGVLLIRSVVQQFVASRQEQVDWLERCWQAN